MKSGLPFASTAMPESTSTKKLNAFVPLSAESLRWMVADARSVHEYVSDGVAMAWP